MSGYFSNLLARSHGTAEVMRPRVASLFEPVEPQAEVLPEMETAFPASDSEEPQIHVSKHVLPEEAVDAPAPRTARLAAARVEESPDGGKTESISELQKSEPAPFNAAVRASLTETPQPVLRAAKAVEPQIDRRAAQVESSAALTAPSRVETVRTVNAPAAAPPASLTREPGPLTPTPRRPRMQALPAVPAIPQNESEIHVTIGRLEVRAITDSGSKKKERTAPQPMSLSDYLKSRAGGR